MSRIRRVEFIHDSDHLVAEVGQRMTIRRPVRDRRRARLGELDPPRPTGGVVLEIVAGDPFHVFLDPEQGTGLWANPFSIGRPQVKRLAYFEDAPD